MEGQKGWQTYLHSAVPLHMRSALGPCKPSSWNYQRKCFPAGVYARSRSLLPHKTNLFQATEKAIFSQLWESINKLDEVG